VSCRSTSERGAIHQRNFNAVEASDRIRVAQRCSPRRHFLLPGQFLRSARCGFARSAVRIRPAHRGGGKCSGDAGKKTTRPTSSVSVRRCPHNKLGIVSSPAVTAHLLKKPPPASRHGNCDNPSKTSTSSSRGPTCYERRSESQWGRPG